MMRLILCTSGLMVLAVGCGPDANDAKLAQPLAQLAQKEPQERAKPADPGQVAPAARKIKYTADLRVICDDFVAAEAQLKAALKQHQAQVAHSEIMTSPGSVRSGLWRLRVPLIQFDALREALISLGEVEKNASDSEDLTEEYYDLESHIKNRQAEEESLRKLLEKSGNEKLENILIIRRELAVVRDEINRKQGRLKLLANLTDLTTITLTLREKQRFDAADAPKLAETPTFGMRVERTFDNSTNALVAFIQIVSLAAVASAPWIALSVLVAAPAAFVVRRLRRRRQAPRVTLVSPPG